MGDAAGEAAEGFHFLQLQQLRFGTDALCDFFGQLAVGVVQAGQVRAFAVAVFGDVFDEHQAQAGGLVGRELPFGVAGLAVQLHDQVAFPALAGGQVPAQGLQGGVLVCGEAFAQLLGVAVVLGQVGEGLVALVHVELGVEHGDGGRDAGEDLAKACLALAQGAFAVAHAQQGAQGRQQYVGVDGVDQVGVGAGVEAGDDVAALDRRGRDVDHWE
ncbi:hypothetical protein D3C76_564750 [compost metagenome]